MTESTKHPDPESRWFHRLVFSYWAAALLTGITVQAMRGAVPATATPLVQTLAWVFGSILLAMFGVAGWEAFTKMRSGR